MTLTDTIRETGKIIAAVSLGIGLGYAHYRSSNYNLAVISAGVTHNAKLEQYQPPVRCYGNDGSDTPAITCYETNGDRKGNSGGGSASVF